MYLKLNRNTYLTSIPVSLKFLLTNCTVTSSDTISISSLKSTIILSRLGFTAIKYPGFPGATLDLKKLKL